MADFEEKVKAAFDAEFDRTRPRPGLRGRVIANAVATPRVRRRGFGALLTPPHIAVAGAAAAVLVVAGVGLRVATQGPPIAVKPTPTASVLAFGKLPPPALNPRMGFGAGGGGPETFPYFGPATMTWSGQLPRVPASAPVYRFTLPTAADADAFAARLGAKLTFPGSAKEARAYQLPGFVLEVLLDDPVAGEATYFMNSRSGPGRNLPFTEDDARKAADVELAKRGLTPSWKSSVQVTRFQGLPDGPVMFNVQYQRVIPLPGGAEAPEVDGMGRPSGTEVLVDSEGHALRIAGILRLAEQSAIYPLRAPSTVANAAITATPATSDSGARPAVTLTKATLVYTTAGSSGVGYLEPAYLFTGTFTRDNITWEKRVLVPALAPRALG